MRDDRNERIRARAHAIWEGEGRPEGRDAEHWHQAAAEVDAEDRGGAAPEDIVAANEGAKAAGGRTRNAGSVEAGLGAMGARVGSVRTAKRAAKPEADDPAAPKNGEPGAGPRKPRVKKT